MTDLISRSHPLLDRILVLLMPFFAGTDRKLVAAAVLETLGDYMPATRAELLHAAQIIAFSMSALDSLSEAVSLDLPTALRLRLRGGANALNRSATQTLRALDRCRAAAAAEEPPLPEPARATRPPQPQPAEAEPAAAAIPPVAVPTRRHPTRRCPTHHRTTRRRRACHGTPSPARRRDTSPATNCPAGDHRGGKPSHLGPGPP